MVRAYIVRDTWNLVGPDRFIIDGFNGISVTDEVVEQPKVSRIKHWTR